MLGDVEASIFLLLVNAHADEDTRLTNLARAL
jgi:hypothetical protein